MERYLQRVQSFRFSGYVLLLLLSLAACARLSLDEQTAAIRQGRLPLHALTVEAFLRTWGKPVYVHREHTQFFPVKNGNYVPRFRAPLGEPPPGWDATVVSEPALFLAYPDHGELLGFIDNRLVYREQLSSAQVHEVGKTWEHDALFKTRLETDPRASSSNR